MVWPLAKSFANTSDLALLSSNAYQGTKLSL